jgi:hypothetical protein
MAASNFFHFFSSFWTSSTSLLGAGGHDLVESVVAITNSSMKIHLPQTDSAPVQLEMNTAGILVDSALRQSWNEACACGIEKIWALP